MVVADLVHDAQEVVNGFLQEAQDHLGRPLTQDETSALVNKVLNGFEHSATHNRIKHLLINALATHNTWSDAARAAADAARKAKQHGKGETASEANQLSQKAINSSRRSSDQQAFNDHADAQRMHVQAAEEADARGDRQAKDAHEAAAQAHEDAALFHFDKMNEGGKGKSTMNRRRLIQVLNGGGKGGCSGDS